jgi:hypothetical protein
MDDLKVAWTVHPDFERMLAEVFQDDAIEGIKELVANGFDADATRFDITYDPRRNLFIAQDNGSGMGVFELEHGFYKSGDSLTKKAGKTKHGRIPMGNYGIGTIVMQYLAKKYLLETWRNGKKLAIEEVFTEGVMPRRALDVSQEACDPTLHGTAITINPVRFQTSQVSLEQLTRRLALGINVNNRLDGEDCFEIFVNQKKVGLKNPDPALIFTVNKHDPLIGQVHGTVRFYDCRPPFRGVIVRVNGRQVGSEDSFNAIMPPSMNGRVYADISVDHMASKISFSRARFQQDSPHYQRLVKILDAVFKSDLRGEVDGYVKDKILKRGKVAVQSALSSAATQLSRVPISNQGHDADSPREAAMAVQDQESEGGKEYTLDGLLEAGAAQSQKLVLTSEKTGGFGDVDLNGKVVSVNISHPFFTLPGSHQERAINIKMLYALSQISGQQRFGNSMPGYAKEVNERDEAIFRLSQQVFSGQPKLIDALMERGRVYSKRGISPERMYLQGELSAESPVDRIWLIKLREAGLLKPTLVGAGEERYYGANVILALERLKGGSPAFSLVKECLDQSGREISSAARSFAMHKVDEQIATLKTPLPYVVNISLTEHPLYVVKPGQNNNFKEAYRTGHIRARHEVPEKYRKLEHIVSTPAARNPAIGVEGSRSREFSEDMANDMRHPGLSNQQLRSASVYTPLGGYEPGEILYHKGFGYGRVTESSGRRCNVRFKGATITLSQNNERSLSSH